MAGITPKICHICGADNARRLIGLDASNREIYECRAHRAKPKPETVERGSGSLLQLITEGAKRAMGDRYEIKRARPPKREGGDEI
jgi:hypothetical protein